MGYRGVFAMLAGMAVTAAQGRPVQVERPPQSRMWAGASRTSTSSTRRVIRSRRTRSAISTARAGRRRNGRRSFPPIATSSRRAARSTRARPPRRSMCRSQRSSAFVPHIHRQPRAAAHRPPFRGFSGRRLQRGAQGARAPGLRPARGEMRGLQRAGGFHGPAEPRHARRLAARRLSARAAAGRNHGGARPLTLRRTIVAATIRTLRLAILGSSCGRGQAQRRTAWEPISRAATST